MNRLFIFVFTILVSAASQAVADAILPVDSTAEIETRMGKMLQERLKIDVVMESLDDAGENLRVFTLIRANEAMGTPRLATYLDTQIISKSNEQVAVQVIAVYSTADIELVTTDRLKLLEWVNSWNKSHVPVRAQIEGDRLLLSSNLLLTPLLPVTQERVLFTYLSVSQAWPAVIKSLNGRALITK